MIFRIDFPDREPLYIFSKSGWVGLTSIINDSHKDIDGMITEISLWRFIKEWIKK